MMTDNTYNYSLDYPDLYNGTADSQFSFPLTPPPSATSAPSTPTHRSAFSAVKSAPALFADHLLNGSAFPTSAESELLQQFYARQHVAVIAAQQHASLYAGCYFGARSAAAQFYAVSPNATTPSSAANMIGQLLRSPHPSVAVAAVANVASPSASPPQSSSLSTASSGFDEPEIHVLDDSDCDEDADNSDEEFICVDDDEMDKQRRAMIQRTTVIKSVIANDHRFMDAQQEQLRLRRASASRMSADSVSSGAASSSSLAEDEIVCKWHECFRQFESLEQLATHVTHTHAIASPVGLYYCQWHNCPRAERGFNARYKMLVHVRTHTKEKPHRCQQCDKSFSRAENLKIHTRSHSGEKPYVCPVAGCTKAYSNSSDRFKHTRTHSTEKPYSCKVPGCLKRYTDPSSLRKHVKTFKHSAHLTTFEDIVKPYRMVATEPEPIVPVVRDMLDLSPPEDIGYAYHQLGEPSGRSVDVVSSSTPEAAAVSLSHNMDSLMLHHRQPALISYAHHVPEPIAVDYEMPLDLSMGPASN